MYVNGLELRVIEREIPVYPEINRILIYIKQLHSESVDFIYIYSGSTVTDTNSLGITGCCLNNGAFIIYSITGGDFGYLPMFFPDQRFALEASLT
jgi:hypothetical protein